MFHFSSHATKLLLTALAVALAGCGDSRSGGGNAAGGRSAIVQMDGSSTVFPVSEAVAEEFQAEHSGVRVTVGISGTGGGFKRFCRGETDVTGASRPIDGSEVEACRTRGIDFIELPVAFDGIAVVVNPDNGFVDRFTVEELRRIWEPESVVRTWSDVRPGWPDEEIRLYGPGTDSGTFDYFTEAIMGESGSTRADFTASEDDNVLVQGIAGDRSALGYFGFAYYEENADRLKLVPVAPEDGAEAVAPSPTTINDGTYQPLSRPLFIYVSREARQKPPVEAFVHFYLDHAGELAREVGYVGLPERIYELAARRFEEGVTGSVFAGRSQVGATLDDLLEAQIGAGGAPADGGPDGTESPEPDGDR
ncbi:MAG: PstS family phosphate ABC transporter substrate-binding protein [Thermoanaerobaculia bacterium]